MTDSHSNNDSSMLPPIGKPVSLMIDSTKKMHKTQPKPAPTLQQKSKHSQMVGASRRKKEENRISGLAVYSKTNMSDTSRSGAK